MTKILAWAWLVGCRAALLTCVAMILAGAYPDIRLALGVGFGAGLLLAAVWWLSFLAVRRVSK